MTPIYRNVGVAIARIMSIEANDGTAKAPWQRRYRAPGGDLREPEEQEPLTAEERLAQDSIARRLAKRVLPAEQWHAIVAKYSINEHEVTESVGWLIPRVECPGHHLFKTKCVVAWAYPKKRGAAGRKTSRYALPGSFYDVATWDNAATPDRTLRRWRKITERWLEDRVSRAHQSLDIAFTEAGLLAKACSA